MTKAEFLKGWTILTTQPWGKTYRGTSPEAVIQVEFYYKHVDRASPIVWQKVCEEAASGDHWPSLGELKTALTQRDGWAMKRERQLTHQPELVECPPDVREKLARVGVKV